MMHHIFTHHFQLHLFIACVMFTEKKGELLIHLPCQDAHCVYLFSECQVASNTHTMRIGCYRIQFDTIVSVEIALIENAFHNTKLIF